MVQIVRIGAKNQITLPKDVMTKLALKSGDYVAVKVKEDENLIVLERVDTE